MKWDSNYNRKWITPSKSELLGKCRVITNMCVLIARLRGEIAGFAVFEPKDINLGFFKRIEERGKLPELAGAQFEIYAPQFLHPHIEKLKTDSRQDTIKAIQTPFVRLDFGMQTVQLRSQLKVINVDDSSVLLKLLNHVFASQTWVQVVAQILNPLEAVEKILSLEPDVVTLDIQMPHKNGLELLKELLGKRPIPVIMISSLSMEEGSLVFTALNAGAFDYIQKPTAEERSQFAEELLQKALSAAEEVRDVPVKQVGEKPRLKSLHILKNFPPNMLWAIGSSTGGTQALTQIFTQLPRVIPPIVVVQHIPPIFSRAFAESLAALCPFKVKEAADGDLLEHNCVFIAPGGKQMSVDKRGQNYHIVINDDEPVNRFKPSVDYLFTRLATKSDLMIVAGVLTGMGRDGANGLLALRNAGAKTFAQDEASSVVYGMPKAAKENGGAESSVALDEIAQHLLKVSVR
jgi:two-component system, chemotaxis family, protein-glutamate methylesterase/glutaminase